MISPGGGAGLLNCHRQNNLDDIVEIVEEIESPEYKALKANIAKWEATKRALNL